MNGASFWYLLVTALLIIAFTYFYSSISFQPDEMAKNIQQQGGAVPSVRPGKPTADYLRRINGRLTLFAALFLAILATVPTVFTVGCKRRFRLPPAASSSRSAWCWKPSVSSTTCWSAATTIPSPDQSRPTVRMMRR